jgi:hypothetical protein
MVTITKKVCLLKKSSDLNLIGLYFEKIYFLCTFLLAKMRASIILAYYQLVILKNYTK